MKLNIKIPDEAKFIINTLEKHGFSAYLVGGCVRDSLLSIKPHDFDITTSATPDDMFEIFKYHEVLGTGIQHGTVTVIINRKPFECTTYRIDSEYSDGRHPDSVKFTTDVIEDLKRRDFTINAMAYNPKTGLVDPFGGKQDLKLGLIRAVGMPEERFKEDPLRIIRAIRFSAKLGFETESLTKSHMLKIARTGALESIAKERIMSEICSMFKSDYNNDIAKALEAHVDILPYIIPEIKPAIGFDQNNPYHDYDVFTHTLKALEACESDDMITKLAVFFHDIGKPHCYQDDIDKYRHFRGHGEVSCDITRESMTRLRFDKETIHKVCQLVYYHDSTITVGKKYIRRWLNKIGEEQFKRLLDIRFADITGQSSRFDTVRINKVTDLRQMLQEILNEPHCFCLKDLAVNGRDLIDNLNIPPGKQIGVILKNLLRNVIDEKYENDKAVLLEKAKEYLESDKPTQ